MAETAEQQPSALPDTGGEPTNSAGYPLIALALGGGLSLLGAGLFLALRRRRSV